MAYLSAEDRRNSIIDAAVEVIAEEGFARATTRRIAERAEAPLGALHYCFKNKDELMDLVLERGANTIRRSLETVDPSRGVEATIRESIAARWASVRDNPGLHFALMELLMRVIRMEKPGRELYWAVNNPYGGDLLQTNLAAAAEADGVELAVPAADLTRFIIHRFDGLIFEYAESGDVLRCERQTELLADALVALILR